MSSTESGSIYGVILSEIEGYVSFELEQLDLTQKQLRYQHSNNIMFDVVRLLTLTFDLLHCHSYLFMAYFEWLAGDFC